MALALVDRGEFREAENLYYKAVAMMEKQENGALEKHAYSVNDRIADGSIRNMNIMIAVGN